VLLTIFGAGASYDSVDLSVVESMRVRSRPPLANELFDERPEFVAAMNQYSQMSALVPRLRRASQGNDGRTVEQVLREVQMEADTFPMRKSHLMALEFYLSQILDSPVASWIIDAGRATNYVELLDQIERVPLDQPPLFVTFNYDRTLENAFADVLMVDIGRPDIATYISPDFAIIKPHGSVDWIQVLAGTTDQSNGYSIPQLIRFAPHLDFNSGEIIIKPGSNPSLSVPWHPAIAIPVDRSKTFVCPPAHLQRLSYDLESVTRMLVVGWRATEQHFLEMLYERLAKNRPLSLCIVDKGDGAVATQRNLEEALGDVISFRPLEVHTDGFSAFVREGNVREWLDRPLEKF
jgi:hypothetical protein